MPKVFIVGRDGAVSAMFHQAGWEIVDTYTSADLVQFTGGADVSPHLYGEKNVASHTSPRRDEEEVAIFNAVREMGIPMAGICRGGQFLNVMCGGKLWQDVDSHAVGSGHLIDVMLDGQHNNILVSSTHHQMFRRDQSKSQLIGWAKRSTQKLNDQGLHLPEDGEVDEEVVYYGAEKCLCFQPHPEYFEINQDCPKLYFRLLKKILKETL